MKPTWSSRDDSFNFNVLSDFYHSWGSFISWCVVSGAVKQFNLFEDKYMTKNIFLLIISNIDLRGKNIFKDGGNFPKEFITHIFVDRTVKWIICHRASDSSDTVMSLAKRFICVTRGRDRSGQRAEPLDEKWHCLYIY